MELNPETNQAEVYAVDAGLAALDELDLELKAMMYS